MRTSRHGGTRNSAASKRLMREIGIFDVSVKAREVMYVREIKVRVHVTKTQNRSVVSRGCRVKPAVMPCVPRRGVGARLRPRRTSTWGARASRPWRVGAWRLARGAGARGSGPASELPLASGSAVSSPHVN